VLAHPDRVLSPKTLILFSFCLFEIYLNKIATKSIITYISLIDHVECVGDSAYYVTFDIRLGTESHVDKRLRTLTMTGATRVFGFCGRGLSMKFGKGRNM